MAHGNRCPLVTHKRDSGGMVAPERRTSPDNLRDVHQRFHGDARADGAASSDNAFEPGTA
jgi:hypothetical protein